MHILLEEYGYLKVVVVGYQVNWTKHFSIGHEINLEKVEACLMVNFLASNIAEIINECWVPAIFGLFILPVQLFAKSISNFTEAK